MLSLSKYRGLGESVEAFWNNREAPPPAEEDTIIAVTGDGKGIPIRPDGCRRMSLIGAVCNIKPYQRTAEDVLEALFAEKGGKKKEGTKPRPSPIAKHVRASLERDDAGTMQPSYDAVFTWHTHQFKPQGSKYSSKVSHVFGCFRREF